MPSRPLAWCTIPGCTNRANGRCAEHGGQPSGAPRPSPQRRGYTPGWAATAKRYLATHPWCEHDRCTQRATQVHHVPDRAVLVANGVTEPDADAYLHGLCAPHHARHTLHDE